MTAESRTNGNIFEIPAADWTRARKWRDEAGLKDRIRLSLEGDVVIVEGDCDLDLMLAQLGLFELRGVT